MVANRQLAQQARQDREQSRSSSFSFRQLAQQARRNQEHQTQVPQLPIACKPLLPQLTRIVSLRHQLNRCNILCYFCGAEHWIEERVRESSLQAPKFSTCCEGGTVMKNMTHKAFFGLPPWRTATHPVRSCSQYGSLIRVCPSTTLFRLHIERRFLTLWRNASFRHGARSCLSFAPSLSISLRSCSDDASRPLFRLIRYHCVSMMITTSVVV